LKPGKSGKETDFVNRISAEQFEKEIKEKEAKIIDIRRESEYNAEHIHEAYSKPLAYINEWIHKIELRTFLYALWKRLQKYNGGKYSSGKRIQKLYRN
jgi:rhodanese-related sulfurtransferase